jgi:hypothetical protein
LDKNYPKNSSRQLESDSENFGKNRDEITKLDVSCQNLEGELKLVGF